MSNKIPHNPQNPHPDEPPVDPTQRLAGPADVSGLTPKPADPYAELRALQDPYSTSRPTFFSNYAEPAAEPLVPDVTPPPKPGRGWSYSRLHNFRKHTMAPVTLGLAATAIFGPHASSDNENSKPKYVASSKASQQGLLKKEEDLAEKSTPTSTGYLKRDARYRQAVARGNQNCETKVSAADMTEVFNETVPSLNEAVRDDTNLEQLQSMTAETLAAIDETRSQLDFAPLPEKYNDLVEHQHDDGIALQRYEQVFQDYMQQFGVEAEFDWQKPGWNVKNLISPVPQNKLKHSAQVKPVIIDTINRFSQMPVSFVKQVGLKRIMLGMLTDNEGIESGKILGEVPDWNANRTILLDVWSLGKPTEQANLAATLDYLQQVPAHEFAHSWHYSICFRMMGEFVKDRAFASLIPGLPYSENSQDKMKDHGHVGHFIPLGNFPSNPGKYKVGVASAHGAEDTQEAVASLFGENIVDTSNMQHLFDTNVDEGQFFDQVILTMARVKKKDPTLYRYYSELMKATLLAEEISWRMSLINADQQALQKTPKLRRLEPPESIKPYSTLLTELSGATNWPLQDLTGSGL